MNRIDRFCEMHSREGGTDCRRFLPRRTIAPVGGEIAQLTRNAVDVLPVGGLEEKLKLGRPLRVKLGIDVTSPDIHVGRAVPLQRMRAFQDAFLMVWRTARTFAPERGAARTWILTLVHRRAVDVVRREERRRGDPLEGAPEPVASEQTDQLAWLRFERERVQSALRKLPDQQREALELAYYGGFSQSQLAERLGEPLGTIKSRMHTGLARLRELLEAEDTQWTSSTS